MNTQNINEKTKIFVRYPPGGGGHFLSMLIINLKYPTNLISKNNGHKNTQDINVGHNWSDQYQIQKSQEFKNCTDINIDITESIDWIQANFSFFETPRDFYIIPTHAVNPTPIILAYQNVKFLNIKIDEADLDQLAYNTVTKAVFSDGHDWNGTARQLKSIQDRFNKLKNIKIQDIRYNKSEIKLLSTIFKFATLNQNIRRNQFEFSNSNAVYHLNYKKDILNMGLIEHLNNIEEFLGIKVTKEQRVTIIQLIHDYADAQNLVPWKLTLEDYE
jgi:hypothetical protein